MLAEVYLDTQEALYFLLEHSSLSSHTWARCSHQFLLGLYFFSDLEDALWFSSLYEKNNLILETVHNQGKFLLAGINNATSKLPSFDGSSLIEELFSPLWMLRAQLGTKPIAVSKKDKDSVLMKLTCYFSNRRQIFTFC